MQSSDLLLYAVTDDSWLGERSLVQCVAQVIAGGATFVQLRDKNADHYQMVAQARKLQTLCMRARVPFVVNDDIEAAFISGADGVHIGQDDATCEDARQVLGPDAIVGVSVQTVDQAQAAQEAGADYLGVGALFATPTKPDAVDVSLDELKKICSVVSIPVVGIGGLDASTIPNLAGSGASGAAVVSALFAAHDCEDAARTLRAVCDRTFATA